MASDERYRTIFKAYLEYAKVMTDADAVERTHDDLALSDNERRALVEDGHRLCPYDHYDNRHLVKPEWMKAYESGCAA